MVGIRQIEVYIPERRISNYERKEELGITDDFITDKLGITYLSRMGPEQDTSDLCCMAFQNLRGRAGIDPSSIQVLIVCTQNPDYNLPHTSAVVHGKLGLPESCAAFDISLGCSGYVYGLAVVQSFMQLNGMQQGLFFTADPYSRIIDPNDKSTSVLFGDAATVTLISNDSVFRLGRFTFGTRGKGSHHLICREKKLHMNGREIFNFAASTVPPDIHRVLEANGLTIKDIDRFLLHQGSKFIVDFLAKKLGLPPEKTPFVIEEYGNTVSSSIPIMIKPLLNDLSVKQILITGFGVGLSWASGILTRSS